MLSALPPTHLVQAYPLFLPSLGMGELSIIFIIILILFGPGKLPGVMKTLGDGVKQFKDATTGSGKDHPHGESDKVSDVPEDKNNPENNKNS